MQTIRTFIALPIPVPIQRRIGQWTDSLRQNDGGAVKWVPTENLHLTLKFLGDADNREIPKICEVLRRCCQEIAPFSLELTGTGGFPDLERARVLWIAVLEEQPRLGDWVTSLEKALATLGFKPEPRTYHPHLTIGRLKTGRRPEDDLLQAMRKSRELRFGEIDVKQVQLIASYLDKQGASYTVMDRVDL